MKRLRSHIFVGYIIIFVVLMAGWLFLQSRLMYPYQIEKRKRIVNSVYERFKEADLRSLKALTDQDEQMEYILAEHVHFIVYDQNGIVSDGYITEEDTESRKLFLENNKSLFTEDARAVLETHPFGSQISLYGKIQNGETWSFVFLFMPLHSLSDRIHFASSACHWGFAIAVFTSAIVLFLVLRYYLNPMDKFITQLEAFSKGDFSMRTVTGDFKTPAGRHYAENMNQLGDYVFKLKTSMNNYRYLYMHGNGEGHDGEELLYAKAADYTHQLKTPLAIISSQLELSHEETDPEQKEYYFNSIMDEIDKLSLMISDIIRTMKRSEARLEQFIPQRLCVSEMVRELCTKYEVWLTSLHIRFSCQIQPDVYLECDSLQLEMVLHNYMQNACKHTKPGRQIRLVLRSDGNTCYIGVFNEGSGIAEGEMEEIWKRYYRGSNEAEGKGSGLGLYIVRDIVKRHQGSCGALNCDSGVEFYCILPLLLTKEL